MLISTKTNVLEHRIGMNAAIDIIADAGFDAVDFTACHEEHYSDVHDINYYKELRKYTEDKGLFFNQSHAPFPSSVSDEEETKKRFVHITTAMRNAACLGVKTIVVHPCQHLKYIDDNNAEKLFEMNMDFYKRLIPYCEEYGIKVAVENMWQYQHWTKITHSTCSRPEEFLRYLEGLNSEWFVACLDIGHATLVCEDVYDFIMKLGKKYLKALHVHDVDGHVDTHTLPYFGMTDWDKVTKGLADVGYDGEITFEADNFLNEKPNELLPECERFMAATGRLLANKVESYKK